VDHMIRGSANDMDGLIWIIRYGSHDMDRTILIIRYGSDDVDHTIWLRYVSDDLGQGHDPR